MDAGKNRAIASASPSPVRVPAPPSALPSVPVPAPVFVPVCVRVPVCVPPPAPPSPPAPELPLGGREIFPTYRLVGFCGTPGAPALGKLDGNLAVKSKSLVSYANKFAADRPVLPVFELIAVVVQSYQGADGKYRRRVDDATVDAYLQAARQSKGLLLLNIQPGQSDFMTEVTHFEKYLREPDVGIALDPEWSMKPKQRPGVFYGQTTGAIINEVAAYLSGIVKEGNLPEKALVFHQLLRFIVKDESVVVPYAGVAVIKSVDGLGPKHSKLVTYSDLMKTMTAGVHPGFKLFFDEDTRSGGRLMTPTEVMALVPEPEYVMYE